MEIFEIAMLLKSGEAHLKAEAIAMEITEIYEQRISPFPSEDLRWLKSEFDANLDDLGVNLNLWFMNLAGYASWGKRILSWSGEKVLQVRGDLSYDFFEEYPQYAWLKIHITMVNTPDLYEQFQLSEQQRLKLHALLDFMVREKFQDTSL